MGLKQNTAANIMILLVDSADHVTGKTGLTPTVTASKNGGAFAALDAAATVTEVSSGWYKVALTAADLDTLGDYVLHASATGADPTDRLLSVVANIEADTYARLGAPAGASVSADVAAVKAKTDNLPAQPAAVGDAMTLTVAYDAAKTASTQASVNAIPTTPLLTDDIRLANLDAAVSTRALETTAQSILTESGSHPTLAEIEASLVLGKEATLATIAGYLDTEIAAIKAKTDNLPAQPAAVGSAMTLTVAYDAAKTAATQTSVDALWTTAITEAYAADGVAPTPAQALCMILQLLAEKAVTGTTMTVKKLDGTTTAMTFTLNDATAPTSITRTA